MKATWTRILIIVLVLEWAMIMQLKMRVPVAIVGMVDLAVIAYCGWTLRELWRR